MKDQSMDLLKQAAEMFLGDKNSDSGLDIQTIISALQGLLPTDGGSLDITALVSQFTQNDMGSLVQSFLGDGGNAPMDASGILSMFGENKVDSFASQLGMDKGNAASALSNIIPNLIDKNSSGGALGGIAEGVVGNLVGGLFK